MIFLPFLLGFAPGLFYLWWIRRQDIYEPEPWKWVIGVFALGAFSTLLAIPLEEVGLASLGGKIQLNGPPVKAGDWYHLFLVSFVVVGPLKSFANMRRCGSPSTAARSSTSPWTAWSTPRPRRWASPHWRTSFLQSKMGPPSCWSGHRSPPWGTSSSPPCGATPWGFTAWESPAGEQSGRGLFASMFLHGLFNFVLLTQTVLALAVLPLMAVAGRMTWRRIKEYQRISPFRERRPERLVRCPSCGGFIEETSAFCNFCGARVEFVPENVRLHCGHCRKAVVPEARFCNACGHSLMPDPGGPGPA